MAAIAQTNSTSSSELLAAVNGTTGTKTKSALEEQETKFLTLLLTQMKNQDPLNPMDNAQVTTQLAQLNMATGIEKLNAAFGQLVSGYGESMSMQAAAMIGKNVMVAGNALPLSQGQAVAGIKLDNDASKIEVSIKDANGRLVQTQSLGAHEAGSFYFSWDGKDAQGNVQPEGKYTFSVNATAGENKVAASAMQIGTVSAVVRGKDGFLLDLGSYGDVAFKDVQQIF